MQVNSQSSSRSTRIYSSLSSQRQKDIPKESLIMKKFERVLRTWLTLIAFMSLASSVQCFVESTLIIQTMYSQPTDQVNALIGRMFGTWTMLSGVVRLMCAVFIDNRPVYDLTLFTFIMVWLHFLSELLIFKTTEPSFGVVSPMVISVRIYTQHSIAYTYREMAAGGIDTQYLDSNGEEVREMEDMVDDRGEVFPYMFEPETSEEEAGSDSDVEIDVLTE
ncbi:putative ergosterol biosynthetic protein 28 [Apostichopus japonicus]|uniref:Putative ergosterol biosynthetic protein 28 n=1 Tax=Stichopus japonicus TaxID=307972 RepID=A0A2G8LQF5_STIJA|nr:putative ergosterol biosynthetic protein 28 [Apostichopus japonicus]